MTSEAPPSLTGGSPTVPPNAPRETPLAAASATAAVRPSATAVGSEAVTEPQGENDPPSRGRGFRPLTGLLLLALLYTCYFARELIVPVLLAVFLGLWGNPLVTRLRELWVPRWAGALLVVSGGLAVLVFGASLLLPPAADWVQRAPSELRQHLPKLRELTKPLQDASKATESLQKMAEVGPPAPTPVRVEESSRLSLVSVLTNAPRALASVLAVLILGYFFMVYGEDLLRRLLSVIPRWRQKRVTVDILRTIQTDISRYMLTISVINLGLGACTAVSLYLIGLSLADALFWGTVAGLLNFAPYVGPFATALALVLVGLAGFDHLGQAMLPALLFLILHLIEGQFVTPLVLGQRMAISPVFLLLWLFLWGWMWGIAGLLLAVPMLVCFKIYCSRIDSLKVWAQLIEP